MLKNNSESFLKVTTRFKTRTDLGHLGLEGEQSRLSKATKRMRNRLRADQILSHKDKRKTYLVRSVSLRLLTNDNRLLNLIRR